VGEKGRDAGERHGAAHDDATAPVVLPPSDERGQHHDADSREDAGGEDHARGRLVVGGAVTVAGIAAFFSRHPARAIPANVAANRQLRDRWSEERARVVADNARRRGELRLGVKSGDPVIITPEGP